MVLVVGLLRNSIRVSQGDANAYVSGLTRRLCALNLFQFFVLAVCGWHLFSGDATCSDDGGATLWRGAGCVTTGLYLAFPIEMCALGLVLIVEGVYGAHVVGRAARERLKFTPREAVLALLVLILLLYWVLMLASLFTGAWGGELSGHQPLGRGNSLSAASRPIRLHPG